MSYKSFQSEKHIIGKQKISIERLNQIEKIALIKRKTFQKNENQIDKNKTRKKSN